VSVKSLHHSSRIRVAVGVATLIATTFSPAFAQTTTAKKASSKTTAKTSAAKTPAKTSAVKPPTRTSLRTVVANAKPAPRRSITARQVEEAATAAWKRDDAGNVVPDVRAAAAIVFNPVTGQVVLEQNMHEQRSIASLTKVMTALTFVADKPDLDQIVAATRTDLTNASTTHLKVGDRMTYRDLLHLTLIASDNAAARILARTSEGGTAAFVDRMNENAARWGLTNTHYVDPSGLDARNVSSAWDMSQMISRAGTDGQLGLIMRTAEYEAHSGQRIVDVHTTNRLLGAPNMDVVAAKTGFITKAGYCLATLLQMPQGSQVAVVVLGAANSALRFAEAQHLRDWIVAKSAGISGGD